MALNIPIGICVSPDQVARIAPGYDHLELAVSSALMPLEDDATYQAQRGMLLDLAPAIRAFNVFVPGSIRLVGPQVDLEQVERYVARAAERIADLGGRLVVFGSGGARSVPDGYPRERAWSDLIRFCRLCARYMEPRGVTLAIEPLNRGESNILNTYSEAVRLAQDVDRPAVKALADIYHLEMEREPLSDIEKSPEWLAHVHLADSGRLYPGSGTYPLRELFDLLHNVGYQGAASIECRWGADLEGESARALAFLRLLA